MKTIFSTSATASSVPRTAIGVLLLLSSGIGSGQCHYVNEKQKTN
jgi:hypothetical protein